MTTVCMVCQTKVHYVLRSTCNSSGDWEVLQPSSSLGSMGTIKHNLMWCNKYKLSDKWPVLARTAHTDGCTYRRCTYRWMHIQMDAHTDGCTYRWMHIHTHSSRSTNYTLHLIYPCGRQQPPWQDLHTLVSRTQLFHTATTAWPTSTLYINDLLGAHTPGGTNLAWNRLILHYMTSQALLSLQMVK